MTETTSSMPRLKERYRGDIVAALIDGEATVKTFRRKGGTVVLEPSNPTMEPMVFDPADVEVYGKVVTVLRKL